MALADDLAALADQARRTWGLIRAADHVASAIDPEPDTGPSGEDIEQALAEAARRAGAQGSKP